MLNRDLKAGDAGPLAFFVYSTTPIIEIINIYIFALRKEITMNNENRRGIKEIVKDTAVQIGNFVTDTVIYIADHPVASAIALIPSALVYGTLYGMVKSND